MDFKIIFVFDIYNIFIHFPTANQKGFIIVGTEFPEYTIAKDALVDV